MGYDLRSRDGEFRFSTPAWENVLTVARRYGWHPAGTRASVWVGADGYQEEINEDLERTGAAPTPRRASSRHPCSTCSRRKETATGGTRYDTTPEPRPARHPRANPRARPRLAGCRSREPPRRRVAANDAPRLSRCPRRSKQPAPARRHGSPAREEGGPDHLSTELIAAEIMST